MSSTYSGVDSTSSKKKRLPYMPVTTHLPSAICWNVAVFPFSSCFQSDR